MAKTQSYKTVKKYLFNWQTTWNFLAFSISGKLHGIFHGPSSVPAEILIKINTLIHTYDLTYIFPLTKTNQKEPRQWPFPHLLSNYNISSRCINHNVLIDLLRSIRMQKNSSIIEHENYFVSCVVVYNLELDLAIKVQNCKNKTKFKITDLCMQETENIFFLSLEHRE